VVLEIVVFAVTAVAAVLLAFVLIQDRRRKAPVTRIRAAEVAAARTAEAKAVVGTDGMAGRIRSIFFGGVSAGTWHELEDVLIRADVGPAATAEIVARVRDSYRPPSDPSDVVRREIARVFEGDRPWEAPSGSPAIVMVVGVNGTGKTTTIGKLAYRLRQGGKSVGLAGADTFRAAAGEQLDTWAERSGAYVVGQARGADPGAVAFDAVKAATARRTDVLIVDTAGRLHTHEPLMEELRKVKRVLEKAADRPVDEVLLILDATTGQNGIAQAKAFAEAVSVTGVVLTKLDGTAKGGIVVAVRKDLGVPVKLIGTGEAIEDLSPFDPQEFAHRLVS
jgi:fused signal recognition particle receptor